MKTKKITLMALALCATTNLLAQDYLCIATSAAGFVSNPTTKKWERAFFKIEDEKNVLKKGPNGYEWRDFGKSSGLLCEGTFNENGYLRCNVFYGSVIFNKKTLRYLETYTSGYVDGVDSNVNTPHMKIGNCTPI